MDRSQTTNIIFLSVEAVLLLAIVGNLLHSLFSCKLISWVRSILERAAAASRSQSEEDDDEVDVLVRAKMQRRKLDNVRLVCKTLCWVLSANSAVVMVNTARQTGTRDDFVTDCVHMVAHCILTLVVVCPASLNQRTVDWIYCALLLVAAAYASPLVDTEAGMWFAVANFPVILLNVARRSISIVLPLNVVYGVASVCSIITERGTLSGTLLARTTMGLAQFAFFSSFPVFVHFLEIGMAAAIRKSLKVQAAKELLSAATALLRSCCDMVVETNAEGTIMTDAWGLTSFLFHGPSCDLTNTQLSDLLYGEADKLIFLQSLEAPRPSDVGLAEAVHVSLRGASNTPVKVEMLSFRFTHFDGQPRFMIGLREFPDTLASGKSKEKKKKNKKKGKKHLGDSQSMDNDKPAGCPKAEGEEPSAGPTAAVEEEEEEEDEEEKWEEGGCSSLATSSSGSADPVNVNPAVLLVNTTLPRIPIHGSSSGFRVHVGRLAPGTCLLDIVPQGEAFTSWLQRTLMNAAYGMASPDTRVSIDVGRGRLKATCKLLQDAEEDKVDLEQVQLLFFDIQNARALSDGCTGSRLVPHVNCKDTPALHVSL